MSYPVRWIRAVTAFVIVCVTGACDATGPDVHAQLRTQLRAHEAIWSENGAASYSVQITRRCLCEDPYDVELEIVDGEIVSGTHVFSGDPLTEGELAEQLTLPDLFDLVEDALDRRVPSVSVSYNAENGFVQYLLIDYSEAGTSDDVEYAVEEYTPTN